MPKLPILSGKECYRTLEIHGFTFIRQKGSHMIFRKSDPFTQVVVPNHKKLDRGTLRAIIRQSGLSIEDFI
jgi:predicted RNA binding protein YcfA (HicA-like mRNA interferase family)